MKNGKEKSMFVREYLWRDLMTVCGLFVILLTIVIGAFLVYKGSATFLVYKHSFLEFLGSADWAPEDNMTGGGSIGALIFIVGSLCTCGLALLIATPFSLGSAIFITEISPKFGEKFYRPVVEIFAGIPSVVYGWVGLTVLIPAIKNVFDRQVGHSILAAGLVLAVMIFPTITSVAADALHSVPKECRMAAYDLPDRCSGSGTRDHLRNHPGTCESVRRGTCGSDGHRSDNSASDQHLLDNKNADDRDRSPDGQRDGRRRDEIRTLDHGTAVICNLPVLHLPDPPCDSSETGERRKTACGKGGKVNNGK